MDALINNAAVIVAVLAALTAVVKGTHWVYATMKRIDLSLEYVQHEMHFNGGRTMRDAVARANRRLARIEDALDIPRDDHAAEDAFDEE